MKEAALCLTLLILLSSSVYGRERSTQYKRSGLDTVRVEVRLDLEMPAHITVLYFPPESSGPVTVSFERSFVDPEGNKLQLDFDFCDTLGHTKNLCYSVLAPALGINHVVTEFSIPTIRKLTNAGVSFIPLLIQRGITSEKPIRYQISVDELYRAATEELI